MKQYENITLEIILFPRQDVLTDSLTSNDNVTNMPDFD